MREVAFLKKNESKWKKLEEQLSRKNKVNPDELLELFITLTDDLAYAQTFYPESATTTYLNQLLSSVYSEIYKNKKERKNRLVLFWKEELPKVIYDNRRYLFISLIVFVLSVVIGAFSASVDEDFVRLILSDAYVDKTLENIEKGKPMAIYDSQEELSMFLFITANNIRVSFFVFAAGLFLSIGTGLMLFYNGVMLGAFQYFFFQKGYLLTSLLTIWVHGTLEITAIIIAGGAGLVLGKGFLFPGTYPRGVSFRKSAREGVKIVVGLVPIFILAGFLEGFVTRHSQVSPFLSIIVIATSIAFIVFYFVGYPYLLNKKLKLNATHRV